MRETVGPPTDFVRTGWTEFDAAVHVLSDPLIVARTVEYIEFKPPRIQFERLLESTTGWSHGEQLLVEAALALWNVYYDGAKLGQLVATLDDARLERVLEGIRIRRRLP